MPKPPDYNPDLVASQADLDQQWAQAYKWTAGCTAQDLCNFFDKLNSVAPQRLTPQEWTILSSMGMLVLQQSLLHNLKEPFRD